VSLYQRDRTAWAEYVEREVARFRLHAESAYLWKHGDARAEAHVARQRARGLSDEQAAFVGAWHTIRGLLNTEFRQWVEEYEATDRITFTQWRENAREERDAVEYLEGSAYALGQLEMLRRMTLERDAMIVDAHLKGASKVAIARAIGLSRQQVHTIITAAESVPDVAPFDAWAREDVASSGVWGEVF
jgi:hypothetical protein